MKHYYFLFGSRTDIKGLCSLLAVNMEAARWKADVHMRKTFGLVEPVTPLLEISQDDFTELAIEYKNKSVGSQFNLVIA